MLDYLRSTGDEVQKADVAKRIGELAERFAPDTQWFIDTMNQARPGRASALVQSVAWRQGACSMYMQGVRCITSDAVVLLAVQQFSAFSAFSKECSAW